LLTITLFGRLSHAVSPLARTLTIALFGRLVLAGFPLAFPLPLTSLFDSALVLWTPGSDHFVGA
jgi:hypothetical protein